MHFNKHDLNPDSLEVKVQSIPDSYIEMLKDNIFSTLDHVLLKNITFDIMSNIIIDNMDKIPREYRQHLRGFGLFDSNYNLTHEGFIYLKPKLIKDSSLKVLKSEFDAEEGSFLLIARNELRWDLPAFRKLTLAMYDVAMEVNSYPKIDRWIAHGFWVCCTWIKEFTSHPNFLKPENNYYDKSIILLNDLAYLLFTGESPYEDDTLQKKVGN